MLEFKKSNNKEKNVTILEAETQLKGDLVFRDKVEMRGHYTGTIKTGE